MSSNGRIVVSALSLLLTSGWVRGETDATLTAYLAEHSSAPADYVLAKATSHRITLLGEGHWLAHDVDLVAAAIPRLARAGVDLAVETLRASDQDRIERLIGAPSWDEQAANALMRSASWPYREYRELLRAAWSANRNAEHRIDILALGPPSDWRSTLLPRGITYDAFMAGLVSDHVAATGRRVLVYCGIHHAYTRYHQAELDDDGRASSFMDRMGNLLYRRFGERVFLIALHKPIWCGDPSRPSYCLPLGGRIDCAAAKLGRPIGFDVVGSPLAGLRFPAGDYYARGHPDLRLVDYTDGYVWAGPIESYRSASIIPLTDYAPDAAALAEVREQNPFTDEVAASDARLQEIWAEQKAASENALAARGWSHLAGWQSHCGEVSP
jgi:hypothetical protein